MMSVTHVLTMLSMVPIVALAAETTTPIMNLGEGMRMEAMTRFVRPEDKQRVIDDLSRALADEQRDFYSRGVAARKLGDLGVTEAKDTLRRLALELPWSDATRELKSSASVAYWKLVVKEEPVGGPQEDLLVRLVKASPSLHGTPVEPYAGGLSSWAASELASRGVKRALPDILAYLQAVSPKGEFMDNHARDTAWLYPTQIDLLTGAPNREAALAKALTTKDPTQYQRLHSWAIEELGKIETTSAVDTLVSYAVGLQRRWHDENGKEICESSEDPLACSGASSEYRTIITILRFKNMTDQDLRARGLEPRRFFVTSEGPA